MFRNFYDWSCLDEIFLKNSLPTISEDWRKQRNLFSTYFLLKPQEIGKSMCNVFPSMFDEETGKTHRTVNGSIEIDVPRFSRVTCTQNKNHRVERMYKQRYSSIVYVLWINLPNWHRWILADAIGFLTAQRTVNGFYRNFPGWLELLRYSFERYSANM